MRLIDADAKTFPTPFKYNGTKYAEGWNACLNSITQQPTINTVPVVHGEWKYNEKTGEVKCNLCGAIVAVTMYRPDLETILADENYCFKCGTKMSGRNEDS